MTSKESAGRAKFEERTTKTAGRIVKYSREIYHLDSVEEVANLSLEATPQVIDGHPSSAVIEVRNDELRVLSSMLSGLRAGEDPGALVREAHEHDTVVVCADESVEVTVERDNVRICDPAGCESDRYGVVTLAAPTVYRDELGERGAILLVAWPSLDRMEEYHVTPTDYFAEHIATAITNIRSRERLERARTDLAKRKEMVEVYDRLLRHDLGNDLQIIHGFSERLLREAETDQFSEQAKKIKRTAQSASELIDSVGQTVQTLQQEGDPKAMKLEPILSKVVDEVDGKFASLTVEYDPEEFDTQVYAADLIDSVFTNILSNAAVHNDEPVVVRVKAGDPTPDTITVCIADDGTGIPEAVRDELFEMGKKGPESDGTGFGLGLARTLVESYGGAIEVYDSDRGGAEFQITLERA